MRLVTLNLRYAGAPDGPNEWSHRRDAVIELLRDLDPDVCCLQEALSAPLGEVVSALPGRRAYGVGRDDGFAGGEFSAILVRGAPVVESGTFWLSPTPFRPGSAAWGASHPRVCTWVRLAEGARVFAVHLDHRSSEARDRGLAIVLERIRSEPNAAILTGDFNAEMEEPALRRALAAGLVDLVQDSGPTYHGFGDGAADRIDHILGYGAWRVRSARVVREMPQGRYPSDHWPVFADLLPPPTA